MQCIILTTNECLPKWKGEDTAHIVFKVVRKGNKNLFDTYTRKYVPIFDDVKELREYLLSNFKDELSPAADANAFRLGYVGSKNRKLTTCSEVHLAEAYSNSKDGWLTLWVDPHETSKAKASSTGRSVALPNLWHLMQAPVRQVC